MKRDDLLQQMRSNKHAVEASTGLDGPQAAVVGIVVSDTADEVAIKSIGGVVNRYRTADVVRRSRQKTSSMPTGLQGGLREHELVDLVEYLVALRTK